MLSFKWNLLDLNDALNFDASIFYENKLNLISKTKTKHCGSDVRGEKEKEKKWTLRTITATNKLERKKSCKVQPCFKLIYLAQYLHFPHFTCTTSTFPPIINHVIHIHYYPYYTIWVVGHKFKPKWIEKKKFLHVWDMNVVVLHVLYAMQALCTKTVYNTFNFVINHF